MKIKINSKLIVATLFTLLCVMVLPAQAQTPIAQLHAAPDRGVVPLTVTFTDRSSGDPLWIWWSFGDGTGSSSHVNQIKHTYSTAGIYKAYIKETNDEGSDESEFFYIIVLEADKPAADFSVTPTSGNVPLTVTFKDKSYGNPLWKWWGFGDGTGSSSTAKTVTHTYKKAGKYTVFLKVTNRLGTSTKTNPVPITVTEQKPAADFSVTPTSGNTPLKVTFKDKSTGGKALWKWWGFGDGTGSDSTAKTVTHTYTQPGKYTVFLKATNTADSDTETKPNYIIVKK